MFVRLVRLEMPSMHYLPIIYADEAAWAARGAAQRAAVMRPIHDLRAAATGQVQIVGALSGG